ncbi:MAG: Lrp/AsnC family transcriptional regulator [Candidatus Bathyarchaeia archaeon]
MELDSVDTQILDVLAKDARLSYRDIAKRLGLSHTNVSARIKRLEDDGVILGYAAVIDPDTEGLYPLCLRISAKSGFELGEIGRRVSEFPEVHVVMRVSGDCELLALTLSRDRQTALDLLAKINRIDGIEKAGSHVVLQSIKLSGFCLK